MNIKNRLRHIASLGAQFRAIGRTTYNANLAKANGGMVIAATHDQAKYIERTHSVPARSMEMNLEGYSGPFFVDHNAVDTLLVKAANKIELLEKDQKNLIAELTKVLGQKDADEVLKTLGISELRAYK